MNGLFLNSYDSIYEFHKLVAVSEDEGILVGFAQDSETYPYLDARFSVNHSGPAVDHYVVEEAKVIKNKS